MTIMLAKALGPDEFGKFVFSQWLVDMVFLSLAFGLPGAAARFFAEYKEQPLKLLAFQRWFLLRALIAIVAISVISALVAMAFNGEVNLKLTALQAGWSASAATWSLLLARAQGLQQFKRVAISNILYVLVMLTGCVFFIPHGAHASDAMLLAMLGTTAAVVIAWAPLPRFGSMHLGEYSMLDRRLITQFGINVWISSVVAALVWSRGEIIAVRAELGVSDVAIYSIAISLAGIANQGVMLLTGAVGQQLTQMWGMGNRDGAINLCRRFTDILTLSAGLLSIFLVAFSPELVELAFGPGYSRAAISLAILGVGAIGFTSAATNQLLLIKTNGSFGRNVNILGALCLLGMAFYLVGVIGIEGAAISRVIVQVGVGLVTLYYARRLVSVISVNWKNQLKIAAVLVPFSFATICSWDSFVIRFLLFAVALAGMIFILRDDAGELVFGLLIEKLHGIIK